MEEARALGVAAGGELAPLTTIDDSAVDLIVLGSGAAGMTAALTGALHGLDVLLVEKAPCLGGNTARSAGSVWIPNSPHSGGDDTPERALAYLRNAVGNRLRERMALAFLRTGPAMIAELEAAGDVAFRAYAYHPDYLPDLEGATLRGRVLEPLPFDARVLGRDLARLGHPLPEFTLAGGMMVDRTDIGHLLKATSSLAALRHVAGLFGRYGVDRLRFGRATRLVMGMALVGRLYAALRRRGVTVRADTAVSSLVIRDGAVAGAVLRMPEGEREKRARRGVVLATGGFSRNPALRAKLMPAALSPHSPVIETATGDGLALAEAAGGHLGTDHANNGFWTPISTRRRRDGSTAAFPHLVLDRGKPGLIAIDPDGNRFVNEATSYHRFVEAMLLALAARPRQSCYLLCDHAFIARYGLGMVRPGRLGLRGAVRDGYLLRADTLEGLAALLAVPADTLAATVARHNAFARAGVDQDFGKGTDAYQRNMGDATHGPNPCIGEMARPPFYAIRIHPGELGASCGLVTDEHARVLRRDGSAVPGLYACGADMDSIMAGAYPAPGITLGPGMTFGYIAARHAAGLGDASQA